MKHAIIVGALATLLTAVLASAGTMFATGYLHFGHPEHPATASAVRLPSSNVRHPRHAAKPRRTHASTPLAAPAPSCGLTVGADGSAGPVACPDGRLNKAAVTYYRDHGIGLNLLALAGHQPTMEQLDGAICDDLSHTGGTTLVEEQTILQGLTAADDWHVGVNPASNPNAGNC